jgi:hypothetical protein
MDEITLDWSTAEVNDGTVTVELSGKPATKWVKHFDRTVQLLHRGNWSEVKLKNRKIRLGVVSAGSEDDVRHFLESLVLEANTTIEPDEQQVASDSGSREDQAMTERLRSFAEAAEA